MRKAKFLILLAALAACVFVACTAKNDEITVDDKLDKAVGEAILKESENGYYDGECSGEGHIILGVEKVFDNEIRVYVLTMYGEYGFENGNFVKVSGTGLIPEVINFSTENGYEAINFEYPKDGSEYAKSIKEMFPTKWESRALKSSEEDYNELKNQEEQYAKDYLKSIGREATIGQEEELKLLTDNGVSVEVSNKLLELEKYLLAGYPFWIGTRETLEVDEYSKIPVEERFIYETKLNEEENRIEYTKTKVGTDTVYAFVYIDAETGDIIEQSK